QQLRFFDHFCFALKHPIS
ncbi:hypothetical protein pipiens_016402, partial [Culex pipiens pipiens]